MQSGEHPVHATATNGVVQIESSRLLPAIMVCCVLSSVSLVVSAFVFYQLTKVEREVRIEQLIQEDQNAIMIREGLKQPTDNAHGPGNYQYDPNLKRKP